MKVFRIASLIRSFRCASHTDSDAKPMARTGLGLLLALLTLLPAVNAAEPVVPPAPFGPTPLLAEFAKTAQITFVDIGAKMLAFDGTVPREIAGDYCHPTEKGYQIWGDAIQPLIAGPGFPGF